MYVSEWTGRDCPASPLLDNALVTVSVSNIQAVARYQCVDGFSMCSGRDTITCTKDEGWMGTPGICLQRSFSAYAPDGVSIMSSDIREYTRVSQALT